MKFLKKLIFLCLFSFTAFAQNSAPLEIQQNIKTPYLIGETKLKVWGFEIYKIVLWSENQQFSYDDKFAINITYNKSFSKEDLIERTIKEIRRQQELSTLQEEKYRETLNKIFVSVKKGDVKTALYSKSEGVSLFFNGKFMGKISDPQFARYFVDIWLSEKSSYPKVSKKLLGKIE